MAPRTHVALVLALLLPAVAGCVGEPAPAAVSPGAQPAPSRPTVVALIDSGITPYHDAFRAAPGEGAEIFAEAFGAEVVTLSREGTLKEGLEADAAIWERIEPRKLYAFSGTRVLAISMGQTTEGIPPILDGLDHGMATASLVLREAPSALVVMIQVDARGCPERCPQVVPVAEALEWAGTQSWIDIVSMSLGYLGNVPQSPAANPDVAPALAASRQAAAAGKLIVAGSGNTFTPTLASYLSGLPWVIAVGGALPKARGESLYASKGVDVVANYTDWAADSGSTEDMRWASGTSYATPIVAGTLAEALVELRVRGAADKQTPALLRDALNATASHFGAAEWNPRKPATNDTGIESSSASLPVVIPFIQQGWGYVDGSMAHEIARRVLENDLAPPPEKAQTAAYMAQWQSLREQYWRNAP